MGCVQKKKAYNAQPDFRSLQFRNRRFCFRSELEVPIHQNTKRFDFQAIFKQNLIEELIRNTEYRESQNSQKKQQKEQRSVQKKMKRIYDTNQIISSKGASVSAAVSPKAKIIRKRSLSEMNY